MKRAAVLASIALAGLAAAGLSAQGQPAMADIEQVSANVWRIFGQGGTTTVFVRADGVALVDTKLANNGAAILAQVRKVTDKPVTLIVSTHSHGDHVGSNAEINPRAEIEVVAHASTARRMAAMSNVGTASRTFDERLTLGSGGDRIELYWFGAGHTDGDAFVVFPAERVMAAGDIFQLMAMPRIDRGSGGSALGLATTMTKAQDTIGGVDVVVPGHDPSTRTWAEFRAYVAFAVALADAARGAETPAEALAVLEGNAAMRPFVDDAVTAGARQRAVNGLNAAFEELRELPSD